MQQKKEEFLNLSFDLGTLTIEGLQNIDPEILPKCLKFDKRINVYRTQAQNWLEIKKFLEQHDFVYENFLEFSKDLKFKSHILFEARKHQKEALEAWFASDCQGQIIIPTGSGKSLLALWAIQELQTSALIVVPTLDLVNQWKELLLHHLGVDIGIIGGGKYELKAITVITYASAAIHMERFGDYFALLVFDECHHLPSDQNRHAAQMSMAPYRMGLSATPERSDGREDDLDTLIGPMVYRKAIDELASKVLAPFEVQKIQVELNDKERAEYEYFRAIYLNYLKEENIRIFGAKGWTNFIFKASQSNKGREALEAYNKQKKLSLNPEAKVDVLKILLSKHMGEQVLIFTHENDMAYRLSEEFLIAAITHQTGLKERRELLAAFKNREIGALLSSRVLNEGVDVPEASVAIVMGGTASTREHTQRLGRILRSKEGKRAVFYELISAKTVEMNTSKRRKHS